MEKNSETLRSLTRIEGEILKLSERVAGVELWQSWLKGGWAALAAAWAYFCKVAHGK